MTPAQHGLCERWQREGKTFALATVIRVHGSSSAKAGSVAVIDFQGRNVDGWVGGGCAEAFVCKQAQAAIEERASRIVDVDLDDEVFGVGMPCGGHMEVFIEPVLSRPVVKISGPADGAALLSALYSDQFEFSDGPAQVELKMQLDLPVLPLTLLAAAKTVALVSRSTGTPLAVARGLRAESLAPAAIRGIFVIGSSRITQELARLASLLKWPATVAGRGLVRSDYPASVVLFEIANYESISIPGDRAVIVASHHKGDEPSMRAALAAGAPYVGLVASASRSKLVMERAGALTESRVRAPTGLDIGGNGPADIALSVIAELISLHYRVSFSDFLRS